MLEAAVARIAEACLEAPLCASPWAHVADALGRELGDRRIVVVSLAPGWSPMGPSFTAGLDPAALALAVDEVHRTNPWARISRRYRSGHFGHGYDEVTPAEVRSGAFYNEWMAPCGLGPNAVYGGFPVLRDGVDELLVAVMGRSGVPEMDAEQVAVFARAMRYLERTFLVLEKLSRDGASPANGGDGAPLWSSRVLDRIRLAAFVVDASARVLYANESAQAMLDAGDPVACARKRLRLANEMETRRLHELVATAASNLAASGGALLVESERERSMTVQLIVTPLPGSGPVPSRALVLVAAGDVSTRRSEEILRRSFGLTHAEASLAVRLATVLELRAAAEIEQISYETARTYFKRAADKMGVRSQAAAIDRIRLLGIVDDTT